MSRYGRDFKTVTRAKGFNKPLSWTGPKKVFINSWSDFFIEEADPWRDEAWDIIKRTQHLTYLIPTKRAEGIKNCLPLDWGDGYPNVWLGVSVEDSGNLWRVIALEDIPAKVKFVSYEPALGYVDFTAFSPTIDWLISGGESGYQPRAANLNWFRQVRDDCLGNDILYFHKQHGGSRKVDGSWGGRELDGQTWNQMPEVETVPEIKQMSMI